MIARESLSAFVANRDISNNPRGGVFMKKLQVLILATVALISSCCTSYVDMETPVLQSYQLDFSVGFDPDSRLFLDEEMCYAWEGYEYVGVYASKHHELNNSPYNIILNKETGVASLSVRTSTPITDDMVMAYIPYTALNDGRHSGKVQMSIPMSQTQSVGGLFNVENGPSYRRHRIW